ncbi:hypothetical protein quinque_010951 [Culex quinquefasciatus]
MKCLIFAFLFVAVMVQNSAAAPKYQILEPRDGYIPVYIRYGDEPLAGINPALAAAFHEPVNRVSRAELAQVLQRDESPNNTSSNSTSFAPAKYQDLPKKDGYVPVYIRIGNTPLDQINRDLAAAFQKANARSVRGTLIQQLNRNARFSSESSSASSEETNHILKRLDPNYHSSESDPNTSESNSSEQLLLNDIVPAVKTPVKAGNAL